MWFAFKRILLLLVFAAIAYCLWPRESSLRTFQPAELATLETEASKFVAAKNVVPMAVTHYKILDTQYKVPPLTAIRMAFDMSRAASIFRSAPDVSDQEKALPWLESYFASLKSVMKGRFDATTASKLQLQEWTLRFDRERNSELAAAWSEKMAFLYGMSAKEFLPSASKFVRAAKQADEKRWAESEASLLESYTAVKILVKPKSANATN